MGNPDAEDDYDEVAGKLLAASHAIARQAESVTHSLKPGTQPYEQAVADIRLERLKLALCQTHTQTDAVVLLHATLEAADAIRKQSLTGALPYNVALLSTEILNATYSVISFLERQIGATMEDLGLSPVEVVEKLRARLLQTEGLGHGTVQ